MIVAPADESRRFPLFHVRVGTCSMIPGSAARNIWYAPINTALNER